MVSEKQSAAARITARAMGLANRTHGLTRSHEHRAWINMRVRCRDRSNKRYGGRGITFCARWDGPRGFENFYGDMGPRPKGMTLERKNNDGNYTPSNCKWATPKEQRKNQKPFDEKYKKVLRSRLAEIRTRKHQQKASLYGHHSWWHVRRKIKNPDCKLCQEAS